MTPIAKLARLPRHQRLRKLAKLFLAADEAAASAGDRVAGDFNGALACPPPRVPAELRPEHLADLAELLAADTEFAPDQADAIRVAAAELRATPGAAPRRPVNAIRHILAATVGIQVADWDLVAADGAVDGAARRIFPGMRVFLEDIRSPFNVGSLFRSAESFGVERIRLSPLCADPDHPRAARTAMGCVEVVPWDRGGITVSAGPLFALETGGAPLGRFEFPTEGTMIVGSEELGVSPAALAAADASAGRVSIQTYGAKGSLNVSVAFGIALRAWAEALASGRAGSRA